MFKSILSNFDFKNNLFPIGALFALIIFVYFIGRNHGHVSRETLCKDDILKLNQCLDDQEKNQKYYVDELAKYTSECKLKTCKSLCNNQVKEAIENYKKLEYQFECKD